VKTLDPTVIRQAAGFLVSGIAAFVTDTGVTKLVGWLTAWPWAACRIGGIMAAMVVAWACHRRLTFAVKASPSVNEFARYVALAWTTAALNYTIFLIVLWYRPGTDTTLAIAISSLIAMTYSYLGMRVGVFTRR
jgi:putative flippase GtrA